MQYVSTRGGGAVSASQAIIRGIAPDGGLYVPESIPSLAGPALTRLQQEDYRHRAVEILSAYLEEFSPEQLSDIAAVSYGSNFDVPAIAPLHMVEEDTGFLELWHGPTSAFKDMALQIMPRLLTASLARCGEKRTVSILVATSGDTGKAALEGFRDVPGTRILVFYPRDGVSPTQKLQMATQEGSNVQVTAVEGNFDDAQKGVKEIFADQSLAEELDRRGFFLSSANSINWGRLVPQIAYYFSAYCDMVQTGAIRQGDELDFAVPTGNFGDILAGWYAKRMGLPVGRLICASNENDVLTEFLATGVYNRNRPFHLTSSPSMDILVSSNVERLLYGLTGDPEQVSGYMQQLSRQGRYQVSPALGGALRREFIGGSCLDSQCREEIGRLWNRFRYLADTHTAVASRVLADLRQAEGTRRPTVVVSTASPFKFGAAVLQALGQTVRGDEPDLVERLSACTGLAAPASLAGLGRKPVRFRQWVSRENMRQTVSDFLR